MCGVVVFLGLCQMNDQIDEFIEILGASLRCFGPHHLTFRGSMGDFKVFFGPFVQLQAFRPVMGKPGGCNFMGKLN